MVCDRSRSLDGWRGRTWAARRSRIDMVAIVAPADGSPSVGPGAGQLSWISPIRTGYPLKRKVRPTRVSRARFRRMDVLCCGKWTSYSVRSGVRSPCRHATRSSSGLAPPTPALRVERQPGCRTGGHLRLGVQRTGLLAAGMCPRARLLPGEPRRSHASTTPLRLATLLSREAARGSGCRACAATYARTSTLPDAAGPSPFRRRTFSRP